MSLFRRQKHTHAAAAEHNHASNGEKENAEQAMRNCFTSRKPSVLVTVLKSIASGGNVFHAVKSFPCTQAHSNDVNVGLVSCKMKCKGSSQRGKMVSWAADVGSGNKLACTQSELGSNLVSGSAMDERGDPCDGGEEGSLSLSRDRLYQIVIQQQRKLKKMEHQKTQQTQEIERLREWLAQAQQGVPWHRTEPERIYTLCGNNQSRNNSGNSQNRASIQHSSHRNRGIMARSKLQSSGRPPLHSSSSHLSRPTPGENKIPAVSATDVAAQQHLEQEEQPEPA